MVIIDNRTPAEKVTHKWIVAGTDSFFSGWGKARGGTSYVGWACRSEDLEKVERWVRSRGDMKRVRIVSNDWRPRGPGHARIYVVNERHWSLN